MKELYLELMIYAAMMSGYPMPDTLPDVYFVEQKFFNQTYCKGLKKCTVVGWYIDESTAELYKEIKHQDIYINSNAEQYSDDFSNSVVVHEFVHFLQDQAKLIKRSSENSYEFTLEIQADYVQNKYVTSWLSFFCCVFISSCHW